MTALRIDWRLNMILFCILFLVAILSLTLGSTNISAGEVFAVLLGQSQDEILNLVVIDIRLPRLLAGIMVGGFLALAGAALQGLLRNPLADPGVIGVSASAGFGAVLVIQLGWAALSPLVLPAAAMVGAVISVALLYILARRDSSILTLILIGVGINALAGAMTSLAMNLSDNPFSLAEMVLWLLGSLSNRSFTDIALGAPFIVLGSLCLLSIGGALRALSLGEETAQTLGVNITRTRTLAVLGAGVGVGASVAIAGMVGFVGLVVPHIIRPFVGHDPGRLLLPSALLGAILVPLADIFIRIVPSQNELKLGVMTALMGTPFFLYLVVKTRRNLR